MRYSSKEYSKEEYRKVVKDMLNVKKNMGFGYDEYFIYHFENLNYAQRMEYVSDVERISICDRMNRPENKLIFDDKYLAYQHFGQYYHRKVLKFTGEKDELQVFAEFVKTTKRFIVKPYNGWCGIGIQIKTLPASSDDSVCEQMYNELIKSYPDGFIVEELIIQCRELAEFHPKSLNTLRIPTVRFDDRIDIIHPFLRVGQGESIVDNAGSGGIFCPIDVATGTTIASVDELGRHYTIHPDSHLPLIGFTIPRFSDACAMAKELAMIIPSNRYTGWDLALTDSGWVMVEGNARGQFVWQMATHVGFRREAERILKELGI